jgi:hypothetical protein
MPLRLEERKGGTQPAARRLPGFRSRPGCSADELLINGDFIPGFSQLDSQGQILAYAIAFGVAQHLVTRFVDQRADDVLSGLPSKEHPVRKEKQSSTETRSAGSGNSGS